MNSALNSQQQLAVMHGHGPLLVLAGAGSGKTRIITYRVVRLIQQGIPPGSILALTFTNKAAGEMRRRIQENTQMLVFTSTFHSLCAYILRTSITALGYQENFTIFDEEDSEKLLKNCLKQMNYKEDKQFLKNIRAQISQAKNDNTQIQNDMVRGIYSLYQSKLKECNAVDFDDLLHLTLQLFREHPTILATYQNRWSFILVDEYQDTNTAQYLLITMLAKEHNNVFAVGDPDQSIYSWRGARVSHILNFEKDFPGAQIIFLEQNYRSREVILQAANALISHNESRYQKQLWSDKPGGEKIGIYIAPNEYAEVQFVIEKLQKTRLQNLPWSACAIFYRTHFQSRLFEDALLAKRIPYTMVGGLSFYARREIKDILSWLRMAQSGGDVLAFSRTINTPKRGLGEAAIAKIHNLSQNLNIDILSTCIGIIEHSEPCGLSAKQIKGLTEYLQVIRRLKGQIAENAPLPKLLTSAIEDSGYLEYLKEDATTYRERKENVDELVVKAMEWQRTRESTDLASFLEEISLRSSADESASQEPGVRLMTLHHAKGLEFPFVAIVGMEETLLPHANSLQEEALIEEERRLCYVGITRAQEQLYLTASRYRFLWGTSRTMTPSRFLAEIPKEFTRLSREIQ